jgi:hypothetical protein
MQTALEKGHTIHNIWYIVVAKNVSVKRFYLSQLKIL